MTYRPPGDNDSRFDPLSGRAAALNRWARTDDPTAATAPARNGFLARFERIVDPDGILPVAEREIRARRAMRAYMIALARKSRDKRSTRRA